MFLDFIQSSISIYSKCDVHDTIIIVYTNVGPNNLWPWPIFTLGSKTRAEEGYSRECVIKVQIVLRDSQG